MASLETMPPSSRPHNFEAEEEPGFETLPELTMGDELEEHADAYEAISAGMQERHPDWPKLEVDFWFTAHGERRDVEGIQSQLAQTDIYFYENSRPDLTAMFQEISTNPARPLEQIIEEGVIYGAPIKDSFWEPVIRGLYGSQIIVGGCDVRPDEREVKDEIIEAIKTELPTEGSFLEAAGVFVANSARVAIGQNERESLMIRHFEEDMEAILELNPKLKEKEDLKILISIGSYHTTLRHLFEKEGVEGKQHFPGSINGHYVYSYEVELWRTIAMQREPSTELAKRAYTERLVKKAVDVSLEHAGVPPLQNELKDPFVRRLTSLIDEDQMEEMYRLYQNGKLTIGGIHAVLAEKGVANLTQAAKEFTQHNTDTN